MKYERQNWKVQVCMTKTEFEKLKINAETMDVSIADAVRHALTVQYGISFRERRTCK